MASCLPGHHLESTCRLCGLNRAIPTGRHPVRKEAYSQQILRILGIKVTEDQGGCPPFVCQPCILRLKRSVKIRSRKVRGTVIWNVPDFKPVVSYPAPEVVRCTTAKTENTGQHYDPVSVLLPISDGWSTVKDEQTIKLYPGESTKDTFSIFVDKGCALGLKHGFSSKRSDKNFTLKTHHLHSGETLFKLTVDDEFAWELWYRKSSVPKSQPHLSSIPHNLDYDALCDLIQILFKANICAGHADKDFPLLTEATTSEKELLARDNKTVIGFHHNNAFRKYGCNFFTIQTYENADTSPVQCDICSDPAFRNNLRAREARFRASKNNVVNHTTSRTSASSKVPFCKLSNQEKNERFVSLSNEIHKLRSKIIYLEQKLEKREKSSGLSHEQDEASSGITHEQDTFLSEATSGITHEEDKFLSEAAQKTEVFPIIPKDFCATSSCGEGKLVSAGTQQ